MWTCDTCGFDIARAEDGWVEWLMVEFPKGNGLRLVHAYPASPRLDHPSRCQYGRVRGLNDLPLEDFVGPNGMMRLLAMLYDERAPKEELLEMIKRLHIPGYEQARHHFDDAIAEGVYEPNTAPGYPHQRQIKAVLDFIEQRNLRS